MFKLIRKKRGGGGRAKRVQWLFSGVLFLRLGSINCDFELGALYRKGFGKKKSQPIFR
jgi:hypothetical protein